MQNVQNEKMQVAECSKKKSCSSRWPKMSTPPKPHKRFAFRDDDVGKVL